MKKFEYILDFRKMEGFGSPFICEVKKMEQRVGKLEVDMVDVKTRLAVAESNIKDVKEDISSIKNNTTWILRLVIGSIIMALLALIIQGGV